MGTQALVRVEPQATDFLPAMTIEQAVDRYKLMVQFVNRALIEGTDYGKIPGTGDKAKPTLLKPGAEKLCTFFGLRKIPVLLEKEEDWTGERHGGEPFFYYVYRYELYRGDVLIAAADGSCNSWEKKYRWRQAERTCPECGKPAIIKGKAEYGGGWVCFKKKDGCGAKFADDDEAIIGQQVGRVPNADPAEAVNTLQKMAQKRALIAATLLAVNASDYFTQDLEDHVPDDGAVDAEATWEPKKATRQNTGAARQSVARAESAPPPPKQNGKSALPADGAELHKRLSDYDARLSSQGLCGAGELLKHVTQKGVKAGYNPDLASWSGPAIAFAVGATKEFEAKRKQREPGSEG